MKKIISMFLVLTLLLSLAISVCAIPRPVLSLSSEGIVNGDVTVTVSLTNNPGIAYYGLRLKYPSQYLTIKEVSYDDTVIGTAKPTDSADIADSKGFLDVICAETKNYNEDGKVFAVTFSLKTDYDYSVARNLDFYLTYPGDFGGYDESSETIAPVLHMPTINNTSVAVAAITTGSTGSSSKPVSGGTPTVVKNITWKNASDWAEPELKTAKKYNLIPDVLNGTDMQKQITRKEFAAVVVKLYEKLSGRTAVAASKDSFKDTTDTEVLKAFKLGITYGMGDDKFEPDFLITREQVATMLHRTILKAKGDLVFDINTVKKFDDNAEISDWAQDAVYFMSENNIVNGVGENKFDAKSNTTREASLAISVRGYDNLR